MKRVLVVITLASLFLLLFLGCGGGGGGGSDSGNDNGGSSLNLAGTWNGNWVSSRGVNSGTLSTSLTQNGTSISGTVTITGSPCMSSATVSGSISGSQLTLQANSLNFSATATSTSISGTYSVTSGACAGDTGYISMASGDNNPTTPTVNVSGYWSGTYSSNLVSSNITLNLTQSGSNITGTDSSTNGANGTVSGTVSGDTISFMLYQKTTGCLGAFSGTGTVSGDTLTLSFTGADCLGVHSNGQGTVTNRSASTPTNVTATAGDGLVTITWDSASAATSYNIYWSTSFGVSKTSYTGKFSNVTSPYTHTGRTNNNTYYYVVTAVNSYGESGVSNEVSAIPQTTGTAPSAPTGVTATAEDKQVMISWTAVSAMSYNIFWSTTSGVTKSNGTQITGATSPYIHTTLTNGTTYYYVITAVNSYGESVESSQVSATPVVVVVVHVPDTGQTGDYTTTYGEDSDYTINPPSYTDNGDGTITDNVTGLLWQKQDDATMRTWTDAGTYCTNLSLAGTGWRLPTDLELMAIIDYGEYSPSINTTYFPNTQSSAYWSSTTLAYGTSNAWIVHFYNGGSDYYSKTTSIYARCVRGSAVAGVFTGSGNATVTDAVTTLVWQKQDDATTKTWEQALTYCEGLSLGEFTDWRLPNVKELRSIADSSKYSPSINTTYFPNTQSSYYWSSTTSTYGTSRARVVDFDNGYSGYDGKTDSIYARCVRGGQ